MKEIILTEFGLTKNEIKVYLTLLRIGSALAGEITEKSGIHRRNVYDSIDRLIEKGLVSFIIKNNRKYFRATDPKRFLGIIKEEERGLLKKKEEFNEILPELNLNKNLAKTTQEAHFYKGVEGIKSVCDDILRTQKDYIGYSPGEQFEKILKFYFVHFIEQRKKKKIHAKLIYNEMVRGKKLIHTSLSEIRFLPKEFASYAGLRIYGNKVAILLLSEEEPLAIVIDNEAIAEGYRKYFDIIWKAAKK